MADIRVNITGNASGAVKAFGDADKAAGGFLSKLGGLATKVTGTVVGVGVAMGAAFGGTALTQGFKRLQGLEEANKRLEGMGLSAQQVEEQMAGLNTVLTGTPYALNDGATALAGFIAAGVPLKDTERMLTRVADAAAFGQAPLDEVSTIFQRIALNGKVTTQELNQLVDRNIPIFGMLADAMGIPQDELRKLVEAGKISAEDFNKYWDEAAAGFGENGIVIEGAAQSAGETVRGAWGNTMAAMGRLGAKVLEPIYKRLPDIIMAVTSKISELGEAIGPMVEHFAESDRVKGFLDGIAGAIESINITDLIHKFIIFGVHAYAAIMKVKDEASGLGISSFSDLSDALTRIKDSAIAVWPAVQQIGESLATASATIGVSTWELLVAALEVLAVLAEQVLVPALNGLSDWMRNNQGAVTGIVAAFTGFKVLKGVATGIKTIRTGFQGVIKPAQNAVKKVKDFLAPGGKMDGLRLKLMGVKDAAVNAGKAIGNGAKAVGRWTAAAVKSAAATAKDTAAKIANKVAMVAKTAATKLATAAQAAFNFVMNMNPIMLVVLAIGALVAAVVLAYQKVDWFRNAVDAVGRFFRDTLWPILTGFAEFLKGVFVGAFNFVAGVVRTVVSAISTVISTYFNIYRTIITTVFNAIKSIVSTVWNGITGFLGRAFETVKNLFSTAWNGIKSVFSNIWNGIKDTVRKGIDGVIKFITDIPGRITRAVGRIATAAKDLGSSIINGIKDGLSSAVGFVKDIASGVWKAIKDAVNKNVVDRLNNLIPDEFHIGPIKVDLPDNPIPRLAMGTGSFRGGFATVGERGPETVLLPRGASVIPNHEGGGSRGNTINVYLMGSDYTPKQLADEVSWALTYSGR